MAEQFDIAALRHLVTAERLEVAKRLDDAAYHFGLAGETAVKATLQRIGVGIDKSLKRHFSDDKKYSLQHSIEYHGTVLELLTSGRLGGQLANDLRGGLLINRFRDWSIKIRYADSDCPVDEARLATWKADAIALVNGGVF